MAISGRLSAARSCTELTAWLVRCNARSKTQARLGLRSAYSVLRWCSYKFLQLIATTIALSEHTAQSSTITCPVDVWQATRRRHTRDISAKSKGRYGGLSSAKPLFLARHAVGGRKRRAAAAAGRGKGRGGVPCTRKRC